MQQQLQERQVSFSLLNKAHVLYSTWNRIQNKASSYLQSIDNLIAQKAAAVECSSTLAHHPVVQQELIYKQTQSLEKQINHLYSTLELFEKVCHDWSQLEAEAVRHVVKSQSPSSQPLALSTQSLIQVTAVKPTQVHDMISQLACMYHEEYTYKSLLLSTLPQRVSDTTHFQTFQDCWIVEARIDNTLMSTMLERLALYKQVKKVLESVD